MPTSSRDGAAGHATDLATYTPAPAGPQAVVRGAAREGGKRPSGSEPRAAARPAPRTVPATPGPLGPALTGAWLAPWTPLADLAVVAAALLACVVLADGGQVPGDLAAFLAVRVSVHNVLLVSAILAWASVALRVTGAYDPARSPSFRDLVANTLGGCTLASAPAALLPWVSASGRLSAASGLFVWCGVVLGVWAVRAAGRVTTQLGRGEAVRVVIAGTGPRAQALWHQLRQDPAVRYELVAVTDTPDALLAAAPDGAAPDAPARVSVAQLEAFMMRTVVDEVYVALPVRSRYNEVEHVLRVCETAGVHSRFLADPIAPAVARARPDASGPFPAVAMHVVVDDWRLVVKRAGDVVATALGLVVLAPALLAIAAAVRLSGPGPVLFAQERYGMRKRRFRMYKFRTMVPDAERLQAELEGQNEAGGPVFKIARDPRVTRVGQFLRRTSLDELPQLWNVLRGDMALVGPRPLPVRDVTRFEAAWLMRRFSVRPGLTCLWQVSGRSQLGFDEWVALDLEYIDNWSLGLDLKILARTVPAVLAARGAH